MSTSHLARTALAPVAVLALAFATKGCSAANPGPSRSGATTGSSGGGSIVTTSSASNGSGGGSSANSAAASTASASSAASSSSTGGGASASGTGGGATCGPTTTCDHAQGLCQPLAVCSTAAPCDDTTLGETITKEIDVPTCVTSATSGRPTFNDGAPLMWADTNGDTRYACVHVPPGAGVAAPVPLVVFLHGSHGAADDLYDYTSLRSKSDTFQVSTNASIPGFAIATMQGRNLQWIGPNPPGSHHDYLYRVLGTATDNPDVRSLDYLIDGIVAGGSIDPKQIYVVGWSNGAFFAEMYAIARLSTPTANGNVVAAAVAYAGADPFNTPDAPLPCTLVPYPQSMAPIFLIHRACDALVGCDAAQASGLPPGYDVETWKDVLTSGTGVGDTIVEDEIIDATGATVTACATACTAAVGLENHLRWPDGVADEGGIDHEPEMLSFLAAHRHP